MKTDLKALRELCDAAIAAEAITKKCLWCAGTGDQYAMRKGCQHCMDKGVVPDRKAMKKHALAPTDPQTVRALIDEIDRYRAALESIDGILRWMANKDADYTAEQLRGMAKKASDFQQHALKGTDDE